MAKGKNVAQGKATAKHRRAETPEQAVHKTVSRVAGSAVSSSRQGKQYKATEPVANQKHQANEASRPGYTDPVKPRAGIHSANENVEISVLYPKSPPETRLSAFEKISLIEKGISKKALQALKDVADLDYEQLAKLLNVGRTKLISKKENEKFDQDLSDKILGLAEIYSYGYSVFGEKENFNNWVFRSNKALGGKAPIDILNNSFGKEEVKNLIGRIEYGVYS